MKYNYNKEANDLAVRLADLARAVTQTVNHGHSYMSDFTKEQVVISVSMEAQEIRERLKDIFK